MALMVEETTVSGWRSESGWWVVGGPLAAAETPSFAFPAMLPILARGPSYSVLSMLHLLLAVRAIFWDSIAS